MKHHPPVGEIEGKKQEIEAMFDAIAPRYDRLNRMLSMGVDRGWRKRLIERLRRHSPQRVLDVATGTADLAIEALRVGPEKVVGVDISEEMLRYGRAKVERLKMSDLITLQKGDAERLPFSDKQFDAVLVAFGVRNFENLQSGLRDIYRVLRSGGVLIVLEFSKPRAFPIKQLYGWYTRVVLPRIGRTVSGDEGAYSYLPASIAAFPDGKEFIRELEHAGYEEVKQERLSFGIATLYEGIKAT